MAVFNYFCNPKMLSQGHEKITSLLDFFLTNNNQSVNLSEKIRKSQDIKKLQIESVFLN